MQSRAKSSKSGSGFMARLQAFFNLATRWISRSSLNTPLHQPRHKRVGCCEGDGEDAAGGSSTKLCSCYACWCGGCDALNNHDRSYLPRESLSTDSSSQLLNRSAVEIPLLECHRSRPRGAQCLFDCAR